MQKGKGQTIYSIKIKKIMGVKGGKQFTVAKKGDYRVEGASKK